MADTTNWDLSRLRDRTRAIEEELDDIALSKVNGEAWAEIHIRASEAQAEVMGLTQFIEGRLGSPDHYMEPDADEPEPVLLADLKLMQSLALPLAAGANTLHDVTPVRQTARGYVFDVRVLRDGEPTGRVARVTVELGRIEDGAAPCAG